MVGVKKLAMAAAGTKAKRAEEVESEWTMLEATKLPQLDEAEGAFDLIASEQSEQVAWKEAPS